MSLQNFWRIKIYVPRIDAPWKASVEQIVGGSEKEVEAVIEAVRRVPGVGRVGDYDALFELDFGFEGYRPREGAHPRYGAVGETVTIAKAAIITYLRRDCEPGLLHQLVAEVGKVHPWEHPVIEFSECLLHVPLGHV